MRKIGLMAFVVAGILAVLKLTNVISWSWVWIFSPVWVFAFGGFIFIMIMYSKWKG